MRLTQAHVQFWINHGPVPNWARAVSEETTLKAKISRSEIHTCINAHADQRHRPNEIAAWNLIVLLKSHRRRAGAVLACLDALSAHPGCLINPKRRAGYARKWAKAIRRGAPRGDA